MSYFQTHALPLTIRGWYVFPVSLEKKPLVKWSRDATLSPALVMKWAKKWPDALVGVSTGPSGLLVVDLDLDPAKGLNGPAEWVKLLAENANTLKDALTGSDLTYEVTTRRGGKHLYYAGNGPTSTGTLARGIDTRGRGGYVIAWPNVTRDMPLAPVPEWLSKILQERARVRPVFTSAELTAFITPEEKRIPLSRVDLFEFAMRSHTAPSCQDALKVYDGKAWGAKGERDQALHRLCYALVSSYPWLDPEGSADLFTRSCAAVEREDNARTSVQWVAAKLRSKIGPVASDQANAAKSSQEYDLTMDYLNEPRG